MKSVQSYFNIKELVDEKTFLAHGERAWKFFDPRLLETLFFLRTALERPFYVNDWYRGGRFDERGLRTNICDTVKSKTRRGQLYLSAHRQGMAVDFDVKGMTAEEVRNYIISIAHVLPHKVRLEHNMNGKPISWVHLDVFNEPNNPKVYLFNI